MAQSAHNQYCVRNLNFETAGLSRPTLALRPLANPRPRISPLRPGPRPSAPPKPSAQPHKYTGYSDAFYDTHVLYEAFGVYREQTFEEIHAVWEDRLDEAMHQKKKPSQHKAWGDYFVVVMASRMFASEKSRQKYDNEGDLKFSKSSLSQEDALSEFYQNHVLYLAVGARRDDDYERILIASNKTAIRVLQDKRNSDTVHSQEVEEIKMRWYDACYTLLNYGRREKYDAKGDDDHIFIEE